MVVGEGGGGCRVANATVLVTKAAALQGPPPLGGVQGQERVEPPKKHGVLHALPEADQSPGKSAQQGSHEGGETEHDLGKKLVWI